MSTTDARRRSFAIRAAIAKRKAAAESANEAPAVAEAPTTALARTRRNVKQTTGASAPVSTAKNALPPAKAIDGTLSDIKRVKGANGYFTRALFLIKDGDEFTGVTALISDQAKKTLGKNLKDGSARLYGVLQGDTFRVIGLGYAERSAKAASRQPQAARKDVDYSFQHDAIFNAAA